MEAELVALTFSVYYCTVVAFEVTFALVAALEEMSD